MKNVMRKSQEVLIVILMLGISWVGLRAMEGLGTIAEEQFVEKEGEEVGQAVTRTAPKTSVPKLKHLDIEAEGEESQPAEFSPERTQAKRLDALTEQFNVAHEKLDDEINDLTYSPDDDKIAELDGELKDIKVLESKISAISKADPARAEKIAQLEQRIKELQTSAEEPEAAAVTQEPEAATVQEPKPVKKSTKASRILGATPEEMAGAKAYRVLGATPEKVARTAAEQKLAQAQEELARCESQKSIIKSIEPKATKPQALADINNQIDKATRQVLAAQVEVKSAVTREAQATQKAAEQKLANIQDHISRAGKTKPKQLLAEQSAAKTEVANARAQFKTAEKEFNKAQNNLARQSTKKIKK